MKNHPRNARGTYGTEHLYLSSLIKKGNRAYTNGQCQRRTNWKSKKLLLDESLNVIDVAHRVDSVTKIIFHRV